MLYTYVGIVVMFIIKSSDDDSSPLSNSSPSRQLCAARSAFEGPFLKATSFVLVACLGGSLPSLKARSGHGMESFSEDPSVAWSVRPAAVSSRQLFTPAQGGPKEGGSNNNPNNCEGGWSKIAPSSLEPPFRDFDQTGCFCYGPSLLGTRSHAFGPELLCSRTTSGRALRNAVCYIMI